MSGEPCQRALTEKRTLRGGGALELLDLRLFEDGGECGGVLGSDAVAPDTARDVGGGTLRRHRCVSAGADTKANNRGSWFERWAAYLRDCSVELPLRPSAIAAPPSGPSLL